MKKVSVIIPIYNAEKYLGDSLSNYIKQDYENIEFVLVDDGSKDESWEICQRFASIDKRIVCIHQENQGVSAARNNGMKNSNGDYLAFFDSDDYVDHTMISKMVYAAERVGADVVSCGIAMELELNNKKYVRQSELKYSDDEIVLLGKESIKRVILDIWEKGVPYNVVNKLYKRELIINNSLKFSKLEMGEDLEFNSNVLLNVNNLVLMPQCFYRYIRERKGAATAKYIKDWFSTREEEYYRILNHFIDYLGTKILDENTLEYISRRYINRVIGCMENEFRDNNPYDKYKNIKKMINAISVREALGKGKHYSKKIGVLVFGIKNRLYLFVYVSIFAINRVKRISPRLFEYLKYRR